MSGTPPPARDPAAFIRANTRLRPVPHAPEISLMVADEREILEDLLVAACNDARGKAETTAQEKMAELTKGLPLPPGMKLPF